MRWRSPMPLASWLKPRDTIRD
ncbi:hypothetical protein GBAR_LOCUS13809 [Geodia barretti]|uniref:Uncharacterized protein n=1 Tax=Geodia barretti TaxID=519541 RepID=A0AA35S854_GEOBA|nr:hypothetical protein GBAR_LOCUS13809 [Geodia barretti]